MILRCDRDHNVEVNACMTDQKGVAVVIAFDQFSIAFISGYLTKYRKYILQLTIHAGIGQQCECAQRQQHTHDAHISAAVARMSSVHDSAGGAQSLLRCPRSKHGLANNRIQCT